MKRKLRKGVKVSDIFYKEDFIMCGMNFGGNSCCWIIILILLFCCCGNNCGNAQNDCGCGCGNNNGCGCGC